ncbi:transglycosylase SLT domain-containing protein [Buchnera aphidicola]|uniref:transglycosylase SLT domain-containing protein n=1 Tax=Buchnera aphidicola TaxID=9 RepID=UPI0009E57FED|nr:transglycosylase SLT domain-containing protein [Buchnera aphidicola]
MTSIILVISLIFLTGCNNFINTQTYFKKKYFLNKNIIENRIHSWNNITKIAAYKYHVDEKLIKSIIYAESSGNPYAKSSSNAIGLMQIKPSAAGFEIYRLQGKKRQPSLKELYNPKINIDIGTAYISLLQTKKLLGIKNKELMRYATIVSYVNGDSALLKLFSKNRKKAISIINTMNINSFCAYIKKNIQQSKLQII